MGLRELDISQNRAAFGQLQNVNAQNAAVAEAKRQRRNQMLYTAAGIGLGAVGGPALGLTATQGAAFGASALPSLIQGNYAGVAQAGLGASSMAQQAKAGQDIAAALEGYKVGPTTEAVPASMGDEAAGVADAGQPITYQTTPPGAEAFNSYISAIQGIAPVDQRTAISALSGLAGAGKQGDIYAIRTPDGKLQSGLSRAQAIAEAQRVPGTEIAQVGTSFLSTGRGSTPGAVNVATNQQYIDYAREALRQQAEKDPEGTAKQLRLLAKLERGNLAATPQAVLSRMRASGLPVPEDDSKTFAERQNRATTAAEFYLQDNLFAPIGELKEGVTKFGVDPLAINPDFVSNLDKRREEAATNKFERLAAEAPRGTSLEELKTNFEATSGGVGTMKFVSPEAIKKVVEQSSNQEQTNFMNDITQVARRPGKDTTTKATEIIKRLNDDRNKLDSAQVEYANKLLADLDEQDSKAKGAGAEIAKLELAARREYRAEGQDYSRMSSAYTNIKTANDQALANAEDSKATAAADTAIVYNFVKLNDPGGRVANGEVQAVNFSGSVPQNIRQAIMQWTLGQKLDKTVRAGIVEASRAMMLEEGKAQLERTRNMTAFAKERGLNPDHIVYPLNRTIPVNATEQDMIAAAKSAVDKAQDRQAARRKAEENLILYGIDPRGIQW